MALGAGLLTARLTGPSPVRVDGTPFTIEGRRLCPRLIDALPDRLGELPARKVVGAKTSAAAWGDPAVVLRCGTPPRIGPLGQVVTLDGVNWSTDIDTGGVTWMTLGRRVNVTVRVPGRYDSQGPLLAALSPILTRLIPEA